MTPIRDENRIPPLIPRRTRRSVNRDRTSQPICILQRVMAMIPARAVLYGTEGICVAIAWCDGTLRYAVHAVHFEGF